jgi:hypothetical protein
MDACRNPLQRLGWAYDIREIDEALYETVLALRLRAN